MYARLLQKCPHTCNESDEITDNYGVNAQVLQELKTF